MGYELTKDKRTCVVPDAFLLFSRRENLGRISIENVNNDNIIPVTGIKDARLEFIVKLHIKLELTKYIRMFIKNFCKIRSHIRKMYMYTKNGSLLEI